MVKKTKADFVLPTGSTRKFLFPSFYSYNDVHLPSLQCTKQKRQTDNRTFRSSRWRLPQSYLANKRSAVIQYHTSGIFFCLSLLVPLYCGAAVIFRILQADLGRLQTIALLGVIHGAAEVIERSTMVFIDHLCHQMVVRRSSAPWGSFRTPRRERLMADITIISMLFESAAIVSVNGFLYLYQYVYLNKPLLSLLQRFAIHTSVQLVIEWFFTSVSLAIETRYQNIAVMAVWQKRWKRHNLVAIVNAVPIALWTGTNLLIIVHGRFHELLNQTCKMPFT